MDNLIQNAQWFSTKEGAILYFTNTGPISYDHFCMHNHRFCSLTMKQGAAANLYEPYVPLHHAAFIRFGYLMRAIEVNDATLRAIFYDAEAHPIGIGSKNVAMDISHQFQTVWADFEIPEDACLAQFSLEFHGDVTACTFGMPFLKADLD